MIDNDRGNGTLYGPAEPFATSQTIHSLPVIVPSRSELLNSSLILPLLQQTRVKLRSLGHSTYRYHYYSKP